MNAQLLTRGQLFAYAAFALPLAMAALPVYVHVPKLYGDELGLSLTLVGAVLLAARLLDAVQDPLLGYLSDRRAHRPGGRRAMVALGLPFLAAGFLALFNPPTLGHTGMAVWLGAWLVVVYLGFSMSSISYFAIGAELSIDYHQRTRVTATRGAFGVLGVLIAAVAPTLLGGTREAEGLALFSLLFLPVLLAGALVTLRNTPRPQPLGATPREPPPLAAMFGPLRNRRFRWLMAVFVISGVAGAIPGTLILFFVQDVLQRTDLAGAFLAVYFLSGAVGMPAWLAASRRLGKKRTWLAGMFVSVAAFVWAYSLDAGDVAAFFIVCGLSGIAYGAELALPPSMLADVVDEDRALGARPDGAYFGLWQMIEKLNLALAAGIALPFLSLLGYAPGAAQPAFGALSATYALLPCLIKLAAAGLLWRAPIDRAGVGPGTGASQNGVQT